MAVHLVREEQAELFKRSGGQQMGLVNDQQGETTAGLDQLGEGGANGGDQPGPAVRGFVMKGREDVAVEAIHADSWIRQVDKAEAIGVQSGGEGTKGRGLPGANLAGNQAQPLLAQEEGQPAGQLLLVGGGEKVVGGNVFVKREAGKRRC